jgi:hypothetical protein
LVNLPSAIQANLPTLKHPYKSCKLCNLERLPFLLYCFWMFLFNVLSLFTSCNSSIQPSGLCCTGFELKKKRSMHFC